jgi:putative DNA primase/helicase
MTDQQLVLDNSVSETSTSIYSQPKGTFAMIDQQLTPDNATGDSTAEKNTLLLSQTKESTSINDQSSNALIQRLCSLYTYNLSDFGNAENFIAQFGHQVRYVPTLGWLLYTGTHWQLDTTDQVLNLAQTSLQSYCQTAQTLTNQDEFLCVRLLKHFQRSQSPSRIKSLLLLARALPGITILPSALDTNPNLLTMLNGTLDLATLDLQPHNPDHYITRFIPIPYNPDAVSPAWNSFLDLLTNADPALQQYLQLAIGYTLTGHTSESLSFLLHGPDQRPLQLFLSLINQVFGSYTHHLPILKARSLTSQLIGARFLTTSTATFLQSCDYSTLATILNAEPITLRSSATASPVTFSPQAKLWLSSATLPQLPLKLAYLSQYLKIIPLSPTFQNSTLQTFTLQLTNALPAILTWAIEGALLCSTGLTEPTCVTAASLAFQEDQDTIASFLETCCTQNPGDSVSARELYQAYAFYTRSQGQTPLSEHKFSPLLLARNITRTRQSFGRTYHGLTLRISLPQLMIELQSASATTIKDHQPISSPPHFTPTDDHFSTNALPITNPLPTNPSHDATHLANKNGSV